MLYPTNEEIEAFKLPNGLRSNDEAERMAFRENIVSEINAIGRENLTPNEERLQAVLSAIFEAGLL